MSDVIERRARIINPEAWEMGWTNLPLMNRLRAEAVRKAKKTLKADKAAGYKLMKREPNRAACLALVKAIRQKIRAGTYIATADGYVDCDGLGELIATALETAWDAAPAWPGEGEGT